MYESVRKMRNGPDRADHLRSGLIFLIAWVGVVIAGVREFKDGGLLQSLWRFVDGDFSPLFLVILSVVLLALIIRSALLYFQCAENPEVQDT